MKRNLTQEEIALAIQYYNHRYKINLQFINEEKNLAPFNKQIKELTEGLSLTAVVYFFNHSIAIRVDKNQKKNILIIDDSFASLNTSDYLVSKNKAFNFIYSLTRPLLIKLIQHIEEIDTIYVNQKRFQLDAGSCNTFALVNAKYLALHKNPFDEKDIIQKKDNSLGREVNFFKPTSKHMKYDQKDEKAVPLDEDLYPKMSKIHNRTKKIRENIYMSQLVAQIKHACSEDTLKPTF